MKWLHNSIQNKLQMIILNSFTIGSIYKLKKNNKKKSGQFKQFTDTTVVKNMFKFL